MATTAPGNTQTIESLDLTLAKVFGDFYVVPSFQREYVWEDTQVEQLLQDVFDAFSDDGDTSEYFIGSIVVCPGPDEVLELIDGQQRMTTAYLFLCAVRDHIRETNGDAIDALRSQISANDIDDQGHDVFRYRVQLQYEDSRDILQQIAKGGIEPTQLPRDTRSTANIVNAYQTIRGFLGIEFKTDQAALRRFYAYFTRRVKLVRIKTQSVAHALKVFETINDRGVGLDSMDLLKNLLFMRTPRKDFDRLKTRWKDLIDTLYSKREKPLRFLRYYIFANYNVDRLREDEIYGWLVKNHKLCGYADDPVGFVDKLRQAAHAYALFVAGQNADKSANRYLANLRYLSGAAHQHLILLLAGVQFDRDDFVELCRQLENLFFAYIISREPTKNFERSFAAWAPELRQAKTRDDLNAFVARRFTPAKWTLSPRFDLALQELTESSLQKYRLRYVLAKLSQWVNEAAGFAAAADLGQFINSKIDIEHILPQSPSAEVLASFDRPDEIQTYIRRFGNLTLLEKPIDSSVSNGTFERKKQPYAQSQILLTKTVAHKVTVGHNTAIDRAVADLRTFDEWTSTSIEQRQQMLARLARRVWDMPEAASSQSTAN
jgi:hypothetical protein